MPVLRFISERLLALVHALAWAAFWGQGLAFAVALTIPFVMSPSGSDRPPWAALIVRTSLILGGVFIATDPADIQDIFLEAVSRRPPATS